MNIILLGPQGSGKGTQARLLCDKYGFFYFESGAYLRKIASKYPEIAQMMNSGNLVPDKELTSYLTAYLDQENLYDDIIFDGFPRTLTQFNFLEVWLSEKSVSIDLVFVLEISEEETLRRLSGRRVDPETGKIYNLVTEPGLVDVDPQKLIQRDDDKPDAIKKRLEIYNTRTKELINEIEKKSKVFKINGEQEVEKIHEEIVRQIEEFKK